MKNLRLIISTASGPPPPGRRPGTVGSLLYRVAGLIPLVTNPFTLVKSNPGKIICSMFKESLKFIFTTRLAAWPVSGHANTSGKYPGNEWPVPAGNAVPAFYRRLIPGTASMGRYPALTPTWHWSVFPAALSCKAQPVISCLLY
jgi:hypothetical protein